MPSAIPNRLQLTADDKAAMAEYWRFYEPLAPEISAELRRSLEQLPEWAPIVRAQTPQQIAEGDARSLELQRGALLEDRWAPYLQDVYTQGTTYARLGISFLAWFDVIAMYREAIRRRLVALTHTDLDRANRVSAGMARFLDLAMSHLGEAYLSAKEAIIAEQQQAIRELSTPVLQVFDQLLIVPLVGRIDAGRARQVAERLLAEIRDRRARAVVIDVTGVPEADAAIANHLVLVCDAARLMGARVAITGISSEMARTMVTLGSRLPAVQTHVDLQDGVAELARGLGPSTPS